MNVITKISAGDIIVKVNGLRMYTIYDVIGEVNRYRAGETVSLTLLRPDGGDYTEITVSVQLSEE